MKYREREIDRQGERQGDTFRHKEIETWYK